MNFRSSSHAVTGRNVSIALTAIAGLVLQGCTSTQKGDAAASDLQPIGITAKSGDLTPSAESGEGRGAVAGTGPTVGPRTVKALPRAKIAHGRGTNLQQTVTAALNHSAALRRARADLAGASVDVKIAAAGYQPTIQSGAGYGSDSYDYQITVDQPLFDWGRTGADVGRSQAERMAAEAELAEAAEKAALEAVQAHIAVLRNEALLIAAEENFAVHQRFTQLAMDRTAGGVGDATEVELAGVHQGEAESSLEDVRSALVNARSVYFSRVGIETGQLAPVPELPLFLGEDKNVETAALNAPPVIAARARQDAALKAAKVERSGLLPRLSAEAFIKGQDDNDPNTGVGLRITGPTLVGLSSFSRVEAARLRADSAKWAAEAARRNASLDVRALFDQEPNLRARIGILSAQLKKARALRELYEDQFKIGERKVTDLVNVQADIFRIQRSLTNATYDIVDLQYRAAAALGYLVDALQIVQEGGER